MKKSILKNNVPVYFITLILGGILLLEFFSGAQDYIPVQSERIVVEKNNYSVKSPHIPDKLEFAGEKVPLDYFDVKESLDRELITNTYWHSSTIQILKRANRFFPVIDSVLKKNNVPLDFKYLAVIESNLKNVTSPAGAKGYWQFMNSTGKEYGLEINKYVDERYSLVKSTQAACDYLKKSKKRFGSWTLAAASYNMGSAGLQKRLDQQKVDNYYDLYLNRETARYVYRIVAMKTIMTKHENYGFLIKESEKYSPVTGKKVVVDTAINDLVEFAFDQGINYKILKELNPWLINDYLVNKSGKEYVITLPVNGVREFKKSVNKSEKF